MVERLARACTEAGSDRGSCLLRYIAAAGTGCTNAMAKAAAYLHAVRAHLELR